MSLRSLQYFANLSLSFLLGFTASLAMFVYKVSPLRDPNFQPNSANGGSLVPGLQQWNDGDWMRSAAIVAGLLAINLTIVFWGLGTTARGRSLPSLAIRLIMWSMIGFVLFGVLQIVFTGYLLNQWLID